MSINEKLADAIATLAKQTTDTALLDLVYKILLKSGSCEGV